jgi:mannose-1-phosphate guanylyltransferase
MLLIPVILSGGFGSRLYSVFREFYHKLLLPLENETTILKGDSRGDVGDLLNKLFDLIGG